MPSIRLTASAGRRRGDLEPAGQPVAPRRASWPIARRGQRCLCRPRLPRGWYGRDRRPGGSQQTRSVSTLFEQAGAVSGGACIGTSRNLVSGVQQALSTTTDNRQTVTCGGPGVLRLHRARQPGLPADLRERLRHRARGRRAGASGHRIVHRRGVRADQRGLGPRPAPRPDDRGGTGRDQRRLRQVLAGLRPSDLQGGRRRRHRCSSLGAGCHTCRLLALSGFPAASAAIGPDSEADPASVGGTDLDVGDLGGVDQEATALARRSGSADPNPRAARR